MKKERKYFAKRFLFSLLGGSLLFIFVKFFILDAAVVGSPAMATTLKQGELVFIRPFFSPKRNDIVQIYLPLCKNDTGISPGKIFKRILGMPGDTLQVIDSRVFINGTSIPENEFFLHNYVAKIRTQKDSIIFSEMSIEEKYLIDDSCAYMLSLTEKRFMELVKEKKFLTLIPNSEDSAVFDEDVFPYASEFKWNEDFFGPLYIPKKGDTLRLDTSSIKIYKRILVDFENNKLEKAREIIFVNNAATSFYVVKQNYYFVAGDNFDNSIDSRNWGFIPANKLKARLLFQK